MADLQVVDREEHLQGVQASKKGQPKFQKTSFKAMYTDEADPDLEDKLKTIHGLSCKTIQHKNKGFWVLCCSSVIRNIEVGQLGHPQDQVIKLKEFFDNNDLTDEKSFISFMKRTLPRNEHGQVLVPQINMYHPIPPMKIEEEILVKKEPEESHYFLASRDEVASKFDELFSQVNDLKSANTDMRSKVVKLEEEVKVK